MTVPEEETSSLRESVAAEIRAQLARRRLSGRQAAAMLGWTSPYLSRRLTGEVPFDVSDLEAMARLLSVPVASFLQGPPVPVMQGLRRAPISAGDRISATCERREHFACADARCACWCHDRIGSVPRSGLGLAA